MTDLTARLLAAIEGVETATIRYRDGHPGPCLNYEGQEPDGYDVYDSCYLHLADAAASPYRDAEFGLRSCAADRKIMERHSTHSAFEQHGLPSVEVCDYCSHDPSGWGPWRKWPCSDLVDLAEGYGLTEETTNA